MRGLRPELDSISIEPRSLAMRIMRITPAVIPKTKGKAMNTFKRHCLRCNAAIPRRTKGDMQLCTECQSLADRLTVYDRERGIGEIPRNLKRYLEGA